jgi:hypothetical protein
MTFDEAKEIEHIGSHGDWPLKIRPPCERLFGETNGQERRLPH